jgi:hypothetical protein
VQGNLPMNVFSIDIPFKGSQSHLNMRPKVTAVSHLHSGVNDSAVPCAAESDFLIKKQCLNYSRRYSKKVGCTAVSLTVQLTLSIIFANSKPYSKRL